MFQDWEIDQSCYIPRIVSNCSFHMHYNPVVLNVVNYESNCHRMFYTERLFVLSAARWTSKGNVVCQLFKQTICAFLHL
jgi:hypothetical protein